MDQFTRRIIGFGVHSGMVDGVALCRMFHRAIRGHSLPKYLSSDHDPLYRFHRWEANLRILEVTEIKTVPCVPMSHPFVERLIGTIRREYLDRTLFWTAIHLESKLSEFKDYYNRHRVMSKNSIRVSESRKSRSSVVVSADAIGSGSIFVSRRLHGRLAEPKTTAGHRLSGGRKSSSARADRLSAPPVQR